MYEAYNIKSIIFVIDQSYIWKKKKINYKIIFPANKKRAPLNEKYS